MPVPKVIMTTVPASFFPAPWRISAIPAASASLITAKGNLVPFLNIFSAFLPSQLDDRWVAEPTTPEQMTPGKPAPAGPLY